MPWDILLPIITTAILAVLGAPLYKFFELKMSANAKIREEMRADMAALRDELKASRDETAKLREEIGALKQENQELRIEVHQLRTQLQNASQYPATQPGYPLR